MPNEDIAWALKHFRDQKRRARLKTYRDYYDGLHRMVFASDKFRKVFGRTFRSTELFRESDFADNICSTVVDVVVERLRVTGFVAETAAGAGEPEQRAWEIWERNRMDLRADEVHREALLTGDGYVMVWPDEDGAAVIWPQYAHELAVRYSEEVLGKIELAARLWRSADRRVRLNLYYADRIEKFVSERTTRSAASLPKEDTFTPFTDGDSEGVVDNDFGQVPVFHFPNKRLYQPGISELQDVIPLQDALNKSQLDLLVAMEYASFRQRWATGLTVEIDEETGEAIDPDFQAGVDRLWTTSNTEAKFGDFAASDLKQFIEVAESWRSEIARVSGTPLHLLFITRGDFPSGEAMKSAEVRFTKKLGNRQTGFGNGWEDVFTFAMKIEGEAPERRLATLWETASPRSEREILEALALKKALGVPPRQILKEMGYPSDLIEDMLKQLEDAGGEDAGIILPTGTGRMAIPRPGETGAGAAS